MSSLLSPFSSFGQRHAYFSIQVTLHELRDVPLVSGRFQAKWRLKHPYSSTTGAASSNLSKLLHHNEHDEGQEDEDEDEDNDDDDEQGRGDDEGSEGNGHTMQSKEESSASSEHTSSRQSKGGVFSNLFHRNRDHNHHHEEAAAPRPSMSSSRDGSTSNSSPQRPLSTKSSVSSLRAKRSSDGRRSNNASEERPVFDAALGHHQEPRGSTEWYKIQDHGIKWERVIHAGVRIPIEKPRTTSGSHSHSAPSGNSSPVDQPDDRASDAYKTIRAKPSRDDLASAWGQLGNSELRIMIRQDVVTDAHASSNPHQLGVVTLNLAEHAPCPRTHIAHHHHSHPHQAGGGHHHHHLHLHHHNHSSSSPSLCRTETRRFLLQESKTNATLQLTVTMAHIGGSREYTVPPVRQGLVVGSIAGTPETSERAGGGSEDTDEGGSGGGGGEEGSKAPGSIRSGANRSQHQLQNTAAMRKATRIPSRNLKKGADGNAYTPISTAGVPVSLMNAGAVSSKGERSGSKLNGLQFHFTGAGTWERDPDDVVEALFKNTAPSKQPAAARGIRSKASDSAATAAASTSNKSGSAGCRILQRSASSSAKLDAESPAAASSPTASKRRSYFSTSGHKRTPSEGTVKSILASGSSSSHSSPSQSRRSSGAPAGAAALLAPLSLSSPTGPRAPIDGGETVRASGSKSKRLASAGSDVSTGSVQRVQWSQDSAHSPSLQARRTSQPPPPSQVATALVPAPGLGPAHLVSESPRSLTPSPSAQNFLSPSASTVMGEEPTPRADDKTPTKADRTTKSKDDGSDKETALPAPRPTPGSAPASSPGRDRSDTLRKKKSRGMMGITPEQAESLGYRGRGWPSAASSSSSTAATKGEASNETAPGSPPGSPDLTTSVPSRPSSPFAFGLELMRSRSPSLRRFPSPYRPFSPPLGDWESKINSGKDESYQTSPPPRVISTDYSTKHVDNVDQDEGESHSTFSSRQVSLQPYVKARLGRPRSRIGLNEEHEKASDEASARMRASSSASGCPAPTVKQGESPWPLPIPTRPGSAGIGAGGEMSAQTEQGKREVPALIPGAHSVKHGGSVDKAETTPASADPDGTIRASDSQSQSRRSPSPALGGNVWADAQTELEALRVLNPSPSTNSKASSSTAVGRSRSESGPTAVHGGSLKPPPLHTLYAPGTSFSSSSSSLASSNGSGGNRDRGRTRTTSTNSRSSKRSSSRQPSEARSRSRSPFRPQQDGSDKKKAAAAAAALLDNRPGGVPAPGNYVVRSSAAAA